MITVKIHYQIEPSNLYQISGLIILLLLSLKIVYVLLINVLVKYSILTLKYNNNIIKNINNIIVIIISLIIILYNLNINLIFQFFLIFLIKHIINYSNIIF